MKHNSIINITLISYNIITIVLIRIIVNNCHLYEKLIYYFIVIFIFHIHNVPYNKNIFILFCGKYVIRLE